VGNGIVLDKEPDRLGVTGIIGVESLQSVNGKRQIEFVLRDKLEGEDLTPANIGLPRFNEFNQQVETFIAGSERIKLDDVHVRVEQGSYKLRVELPVIVAAALEPDLKALQRQDSLGEIDPRRAELVAKWQARSKGNPDLSFAIRPDSTDIAAIEFSTSTDYRIGEIVPWVRVEKYLFGTVMDMGGVQKANVHIKLEDTGQTIRVISNQDYLMENSNDRLYRKVLVRVEAEQHHKTGELRKHRLLSFEDYEPRYNEQALDRFAAAGRNAWSDVPDAADWVRQLRGGD
jgi:hypothetical protein